MKTVMVKKIRDDAQLPQIASNGAIGFDVYASRVFDRKSKEVIGELPVIIGPHDTPGECVLLGIGVAFAIPWPWQCEVRPRSGLATKQGICLLNSPGTIDPDFRGEAGILLWNTSREPFTIEPNMRIAQLVFSKALVPVLVEVKELPETKRGAGSFGSTGLMGIKEGTSAFWQKIAEQDAGFMNVISSVAGLSGEDKAAIVVVDGKIVATSHSNGSCDYLDPVSAVLSNILSVGVSISGREAVLYTNAVIDVRSASMIARAGIEDCVFSADVHPKNFGVGALKEAGVFVRFVYACK